MNQKTIDDRSRFRAMSDRLIALRRHPETGSTILRASEDQWMRNWRCDVYAVGQGKWCPEKHGRVGYDERVPGKSWGDRCVGKFVSWDIEPGDVVWVNPLDGENIDKIADPMLISIKIPSEEDENGNKYNGVIGVTKAKWYRVKASVGSGVVKAVKIDHYLRWDSADGTKEFEKGDYMVTELDPVKKYPMSKSEFESIFTLDEKVCRKIENVVT